MKKPTCFRIERRKDGIWNPICGGKAVVRHTGSGTTAIIKQPPLAILTGDNVLLDAGLWHVLSVKARNSLLELRLCRIGGLRLV